MMGLPGSGKTTYIRNHKQKTDRVLSMDDIWYRKGDKVLSIAQMAAEDIMCTGVNTIWIDGLILTPEALYKLIDKYINTINSNLYMKLNDILEVSIHIHQYECNREYCKHNDMNRMRRYERDTSSTISIENMEYEVLSATNLQDLQKYIDEVNRKHKSDNITYSIDYELLNVKKCGNWDLVFKQDNDNPNVLQSERWSLGGTWASYDGRGGEIAPDKTPEFNELDDILLKVCPNLPILMYKKIYRDWVEVKEESENDYYGGTEYKAYYEADMRSIYIYLKENDLIED
jgi:hypothetical protein